ncbi:hypothetical protein ACVWY2_000777 [Bradyrhizobium sp. JR6.1]
MSTNRSISPLGSPSPVVSTFSRPRRKVPVTVSASDPSVSSAAAVVMTAKAATQSRIRPTGYHSSTGGCGVVPSPAAPAIGRPSSARWPSHQPGRATIIANAMQ